MERTPFKTDLENLEKKIDRLKSNKKIFDTQLKNCRHFRN